MPESNVAERAWNEAQEFVELFFDSLDGVRPRIDLDAAIARLSPEARMLAWEKLLEGDESKTPTERSSLLAMQILRGGKGTIGDVVRDLQTMSPAGQSHAFAVLSAHQLYKHKGTRRARPPMLPPGAAGRVSPPDLSNGPSGYQIFVDSVREVVDPAWASAMQDIETSKAHAGDGDWSRAAATIKPAIAVLEERARSGSATDQQDLAGALIHLEAYLGNSGDRAGAQSAIDRSLQLLTHLRSSATSADRDGVDFDLAKALASRATISAESGDMGEAIRGQAVSISLLERLVAADLAEYGPALAEHLSQQALFLRYSGDPYTANVKIEEALDLYQRLSTHGVRVEPGFVDLARNEQAQIRAALRQ